MWFRDMGRRHTTWPLIADITRASDSRNPYIEFPESCLVIRASTCCCSADLGSCEESDMLLVKQSRRAQRNCERNDLGDFSSERAAMHTRCGRRCCNAPHACVSFCEEEEQFYACRRRKTKVCLIFLQSFAILGRIRWLPLTSSNVWNATVTVSHAMQLSRSA